MFLTASAFLPSLCEWLECLLQFCRRLHGRQCPPLHFLSIPVARLTLRPSLFRHNLPNSVRRLFRRRDLIQRALSYTLSYPMDT